jgi:hypothetical protein
MECATGASYHLTTLHESPLDSYSNGYSALFVLYEYMLSQNSDNAFERQRVLQSIEDTAQGALTFAAAAYNDREGNYTPEIFSPFLPYSLCQATMVYHRLWKQSGRLIYKQQLDTLKSIVGNFTKRWMVACEWI